MLCDIVTPNSCIYFRAEINGQLFALSFVIANSAANQGHRNVKTIDIDHACRKAL